MKVLLINPPVGSVYAPPFGIICLKSYLEKYGIEVVQRDISIDYVHYLLNPVKLEKLYKENSALINKKPSLQLLQLLNFIRVPREKEPIKLLSEINFFETLDFLFENWSSNGIKTLIDRKIENQISMLNDGLIFSTLKYFPNIVSIGQCEWNTEIFTNDRSNPFYEFYKEKIIPEINDLHPDIIGFSYCYLQQLIPGLSLIKEIRKSGINTPIISGGAWFSSSCGYLLELNGKAINLDDVNNHIPQFIKSIKDLFDENCYGVYGEGEKPLLELCRRIDNKQSIKDVPGLVYIDNKKILRINEQREQVDLKEYPALNLENLPIREKYFSPIPIAILQSSRGCYWRKCAFCAHMETLGSSYRQMAEENFFEAVKIYYDKYGIKFFFFTDECMRPSMLKAFSEKVISTGIKIRFGIIARVEKDFESILPLAAKAGLKFLSFGLESACNRVLVKMNKGLNVEDAERIINKCYDNNIGVHFNVIFGMPTETEEEVESTIDFIYKNKGKITCFAVSPWILMPGSAIMKDPDRFGIKFKNGPKNPFDPLSFTLTQGITNEKANEYVNKLMYHKNMWKIMSINSRREEFHMLKVLLSNDADKKILLEK